MSDKKIEVPEAMLKAAQDRIRQDIAKGPPYSNSDYFATILEAGIGWLAEQPEEYRERLFSGQGKEGV